MEKTIFKVLTIFLFLNCGIINFANSQTYYFPGSYNKMLVDYFSLELADRPNYFATCTQKENLIHIETFFGRYKKSSYISSHYGLPFEIAYLFKNDLFSLTGLRLHAPPYFEDYDLPRNYIPDDSVAFWAYIDSCTQILSGNLEF